MANEYISPILSDVIGEDCDSEHDQIISLAPERVLLSFTPPKDENLLPIVVPFKYEGVDVSLPGRGSKSDMDCGQPLRIYHDKTSFQFRSQRQHCKRPGCPTCFRSWALKLASEAASRLCGISQLIGSNGRLFHVTWDVGEGHDGWTIKDVVDEFQKWMVRWHDNRIPLGFAYVIHVYSKCCIRCGHKLPGSALPRVCPACKSDNYPWGWHGNLHVHAIANYIPRDIVQAEKEAVEDLHCVYRNHSWGAPLGRDAMTSVIAYELGHSFWLNPVDTGKNSKRALVYRLAFNTQHYRKGKIDKIIESIDDGRWKKVKNWIPRFEQLQYEVGLPVITGEETLSRTIKIRHFFFKGGNKNVSFKGVTGHLETPKSEKGGFFSFVEKKNEDYQQKKFEKDLLKECMKSFDDEDEPDRHARDHLYPLGIVTDGVFHLKPPPNKK